MFSRAAMMRIAPFLAYMGFIFVADILERAGIGVAALRWLYPVKIAVVAGLLLLFWRKYDELRAVRISLGVVATSVLAGILVLVLWINLNANWMVVGQSVGFDPRDDGQIVWSLVFVRIAGAALVVPVMEELFWRSFLMRWIVAEDFEKVVPRQVKLKSFVATVILFGVEHNLWFAGVVAGSVYSLLYMRTNSLWSAILAHGVTNGLLGLWIISTANWAYW